MDREVFREYLLDAKEHLEKIESTAIGLERELSSDELNELFRAFHTLKGNAAIIDIADVKELSHEAEHMIGDVRAKTIPMSKAMIDLMLAAVDTIRRIHASYERQGKSTVEFKPLIGQIRSFRNSARKDAAVAAAQQAAPAQPEGETRLVVKRIEDLAIIEVPPFFAQDHTEAIAALFRSLMERDVRRFVLDFNGNRQLGQENARALIASAAGAAATGRKTSFCRIPKEVVQVLAAQPGAADIANLPTLRAALKDLGAL